MLGNLVLGGGEGDEGVKGEALCSLDVNEQFFEFSEQVGDDGGEFWVRGFWVFNNGIGIPHLAPPQNGESPLHPGIQ